MLETAPDLRSAYCADRWPRVDFGDGHRRQSYQSQDQGYWRRSSALSVDAERRETRSLPVGGDTLARALRSRRRGISPSPLSKRWSTISCSFRIEPRARRSPLITIEKTVVEGAGAAGLAALIGSHRLYKDRKIGLVLCGGNIDTRLLASVLTRELARDGRLSRLAIDIPDRPGQLAKVAGLSAGPAPIR